MRVCENAFGMVHIMNLYQAQGFSCGLDRAEQPRRAIGFATGQRHSC